MLVCCCELGQNEKGIGLGLKKVDYRVVLTHWAAFFRLVLVNRQAEVLDWSIWDFSGTKSC